MTESLDPVAHNRAAWDREVDQGNEWTRPAGPDVVARARAGDWSVVLIGYEPVPRDWFPADLTGTAVLCPDLAPVWRECFRVLRPEGVLLAGFMNPDIFIFDIEALGAREELMVRHRIPFASTDLPEAERRRVCGDGPIEYSHTLTEQIGGQLAAGFVLTHLVEAPHHADATARYMPGYFATRAVKPRP
jgi:SAM-dependent methyltransferase